MALKLTDAERDDLLAAAAHEMKERAGVPINYQFTIVQAMQLFGTLQLALRHPKNRGATAIAMRNLAMDLEAYLGACGPATSKLCRLGWDQDQDVNDE